MMGAQDAVHIIRCLLDHDIPAWLTGGWGIDALLGEETRSHKDLDIVMLVNDVVRLRAIMGGEGYLLKELWSENRDALDRHGVETPTAFVLHDAEGRELDVHAMCLDDDGNGIPVWAAEGFVFRREDLAGEGAIAGYTVHCLTAESQLVCHTGYELPDVQLGDVARLRERFSLDSTA